jgi:hypothetical protein
VLMCVLAAGVLAGGGLAAPGVAAWLTVLLGAAAAWLALECLDVYSQLREG